MGTGRLGSRRTQIVVAALVLVVAAGVVLGLRLRGTPSPYGVDPNYAPDYDVLVPVGELTQDLVDGHPDGTRFGIAAGVHRLDGKIRPREGQQFLGLPGAVLSGSKVLEEFERRDGVWVAVDQTQRVSDEHGECEDDAPACGLAEDVFVDDKPLEQVLDVDDLAPGRFYFDYDADEIHLADDPAGHTVETTVADGALWGERDEDADEENDAEQEELLRDDDGAALIPDVVIRNLVVEKFGSQAQDGAIDSRDSTGWIVEDSTIRLNHGAGLYIAGDSRIAGNAVVSNGQLGIAGRGADVVVEDNEIAFNNWAGFSHGWEAGGTKWVQSDGLIVRRNFSHHNRGPGLWTDEGNIRTTYEDNVVEDNYSSGIFHEISYDALITGNTVRRNGAGHAEWGYGAGIQISASSNVTVTDNVVEDNARGITLIMQERGNGPYGPREVAGVTVTDNVIGPGNGRSGLFSDVDEDAYFTSKDNRFSGNTYVLGGDEDEPFEWIDGPTTTEQWRQAGNDTDGTFK